MAIDDLGDGLDAGSAAHLASIIRRFAGQSWVTTRIPPVAEVFDPQEVVRLGRDGSGTRIVRQGKQPSTKAEAVASKHWHRNLLPALSYRSVVVVEGPNDFAALHTLAIRLSEESGIPLPATKNVAIINAGAGGSGGYANVFKLAGAARDMGLRAIGAIDGDTDAQAQQHIQNHGTLADAIIRLPNGIAIEMAIIDGIPDEVLKQAIKDIAVATGIAEPSGLDQLAGASLGHTARSFIKGNSLHGPFIDALPLANLPSLAIQFLNKAIETAGDTTPGVVQL